MNMSRHNYKRRLKVRFKRLLRNPFAILALVVCLMALHLGRRVFICEQFLVPSNSMAPTLLPGDKIWVNKLLNGGRIYTSFKFDDHAALKSFRMPGLRKIRTGDVICFNFPHGYEDWSKIEFRINYVYCKRVLGTPGDRVGAVDGHYWNDNYLRPIGVMMEQEKIRWLYDSILVWNHFMDVQPQAGLGWNIKNWGPLTVPGKGLTIALDDNTRELYKQVIEYETGKELDKSLDHYTFVGNYYFAVGDNALTSNDSRYWGFIPEDFIIGIVGGRKVTQ